jgi:hypothetical protein
VTRCSMNKRKSQKGEMTRKSNSRENPQCVHALKTQKCFYNPGVTGTNNNGTNLKRKDILHCIIYLLAEVKQAILSYFVILVQRNRTNL